MTTRQSSISNSTRRRIWTPVKRVVLRVLKSPRFLYREIGADGDSYDAASRLSFGLWDSLPDQELLNEAKAGRLSKSDEIVRQAERMLDDLRAKAKLHDFLLTWVKADQVRDLAKDSKKFPGFDAAVITDLRTSLELFLDDVTWSDKSDFRELLSADYLFINGRLAKFYGADLPADAGFKKVKLDAGQRAGVLTHPFLMTSFAHYSDTSPILRGVFLARGVLAHSLRPPPEAVAPLSPELQPTLTTRERVTLQTQLDLHELPRHHQPAWLYAGAFRRRRPISRERQRQAGRFDGHLSHAMRQEVTVKERPRAGRFLDRQR